MTTDNLKALMRKYDEAICKNKGGWPNAPMPQVEDRSEVLSEGHPLRFHFFLEHARWMCEQIPGHERDKRNHWLGFLQCILVYDGIFTFDELKEHVRDL